MNNIYMFKTESDLGVLDDSEEFLSERNGHWCRVTGELGGDQADAESGPMVHIIFNDGAETDAFVYELRDEDDQIPWHLNTRLEWNGDIWTERDNNEAKMRYLPYEGPNGERGFKCIDPDGSESYIYLNPSSEDALVDSNVFVYSGVFGDPVNDYPECYIVPPNTPKREETA